MIWMSGVLLAAALAPAAGANPINAPQAAANLDQLFAKSDVTIGVMDSGLGGLSIMADLAARLKEAGVFRCVRLVFFNALFSNDSGYNSLRTREEKIAVFNSALESLARSVRPDAILVGCNTLSVFIPETPFFKAGKIPVLGIVEPGVEIIARALEAAPSAPVLIFGTETTIGEDEHRRRLLGLGVKPDRIVTEACPELASFIEKAPASEGTGLLIESYVDEALAKIRGPKSKALVSLNCTHYGYSLDLWQKAFADRGMQAVILNPNARMAEAMVPARFRNRWPSTTIRAEAWSMVEIGPEKIVGLGAWLRKISPETAAALAGYALKPDLFEWRKFVGK
jgi:glutamate racemase